MLNNMLKDNAVISAHLLFSTCIRHTVTNENTIEHANCIIYVNVAEDFYVGVLSVKVRFKKYEYIVTCTDVLYATPINCKLCFAFLHNHARQRKINNVNVS